METKVLMVCLGNICRSPLAEGILKDKIDTARVRVDSAGTADYHIGKRPDSRSIAIASEYGIDISQQRCRQFTQRDFDEFDHIFAMDKQNLKDIVALARTPADQDKVKLLLAQGTSGKQEVPDPYYGGIEGFEAVFHLIDSACDAIALTLDKQKND